MGYLPVKSVMKAVAILELLANRSLENRELSLGEIAAETGLLPVTARNLLRTLEECGYVSRLRHGHYAEGPRCRELFFSGGVLRRLRTVAEPWIRQSVADLGESLLLVAIVNGKRHELLRCQAPDDELRNPQWHAAQHCYAMRTTRAILAWSTPEQLDFFIANNGLPSLEDWPECGGSREGLERELGTIRARGGCAERQNRLVAIAVPILTGGGDAIASLGCYAAASRTDKPRAAGIFKMLRDCADSIRERL